MTQGDVQFVAVDSSNVVTADRTGGRALANGVEQRTVNDLPVPQLASCDTMRAIKVHT